MERSNLALGEALALDHDAEAAALLTEHPLLGEKIAAATQLNPIEVPAMLGEVLRFLELTRDSELMLSPPQRLDLAWHEFILFTKLYADWCKRHLGRFVHHQPGGSVDENRAQLRRTLMRYSLRFGAPDSRFWGEHAYYGEGVDCGACAVP